MDQSAHLDAAPGPAERGRELERRVAEYFAVHGYEVRRNAVLEGRSGARHEVDVLAERSDPALRIRVAIECKAWSEAVSTEPIARLDWLVRDLALNKAVMVCPGGVTPAGDESALSLGVELWGPDEVASRLRASAPAPTPSAPEGLAWQTVIGEEAARRTAARERAGFLGLRRETLVAEGRCDLPWHAIEFGEPAQEGVFRRRLRTRHRWLTYDALTAELVRELDGDPRDELSAASLAPRRLPIATTAERIAGAIRGAVTKRDAVVSDAARARHAERLEELGIAPDAPQPRVGERRLVWQPLWLAVLDRGGHERVVAVDLSTGAPDIDVEHILTVRARDVVAALASG